MVKLHEIDEVRVYCGPAALMAITGARLRETRELINKIRGMRPTQGVISLHPRILKAVLLHSGIRYEGTKVGYRMTLAQFCSDVAEPDTRYIIRITGHYVTVLNGLIIDNHYRFGTDINDGCKWARTLVKEYFKIIEGK
jgi:hypothetical protein